jgi:hypothetical protein
MKIRNQFISDLEILLEHHRFPEIAAWFKFWTKSNPRVVKIGDEFIDTGVPEQMIDKVLLWGRTFMPDYIVDESPEFHRDLIAFFFSKKNEYVAAPRGFSKTTILQLCIAFSVAHRLDDFIVVVEKSHTEASEVIKGIRDVLVTSPLVRACYGEMKSTEDDGKKDPDAKGDVRLNEVRLRAKGFNTSIRGLKSGARRPSKIVCDDVEEDDHINNPEQRQKYLDNYNKGIQPATDIEGSVKVFGTILHFDSLLYNLIRWHKGKIYRAYDPEHHNPEETLLWPERWTWARLQEKKANMTTEKGSSAFTQEYLNNPISDEERTFKETWLWREDRKILFDEIKHKEFNGYCAVDVADSTREGSDWTGVVVHLVDSDGNRYRVHCKRERRNILGKVDLIFELWNRWHPYGLNEIGIEKKAFEDEIRPLLEVEANRKNVYPIVTELKPAHTSKRSRIKGNLQGLYEKGKIWTIVDEFGRPMMDEEALFNELYNFPSSANDDLSDAEAYITDMVLVPQGGTNHRNKRSAEPENDPWENKKEETDDDPFE